MALRQVPPPTGEGEGALSFRLISGSTIRWADLTVSELSACTDTCPREPDVRNSRSSTASHVVVDRVDGSTDIDVLDGGEKGLNS